MQIIVNLDIGRKVLSMGFFDLYKSIDDKEIKTIHPSPVNNYLGQELYVIYGKNGILYVHKDALVIDRRSGGYMSSYDSPYYKIIPLKSIISLEVDFDESRLDGFVMFETSNFNNFKIGNYQAKNLLREFNENCIFFNEKKQQCEQIRGALEYIVKYIL